MGLGNYPLEEKLIYASKRGYVSQVKELLSLEININSQDVQGCTAVNGATEEGRKEIVALLVQAGANLNIKNNMGFAPLHSACFKGFLDIVNILVWNGRGNELNIDIEDNKGSTPLSWACYRGHTPVVQVLIDAGANTIAKDKNGSMPIQYALCKRHKEIVQLLETNIIEILNTFEQSEIDVNRKNFLLGHINVLLKVDEAV